MTSRYASLTRDDLAVLVPELLLIGQLIDRSGMAWCISAFGREEMAQIAIEEWAGASPIYTRRMQRALGYAPAVPGEGDIVDIFKGLQLDIGAPPQFMDFRYEVKDRWHGEFRLDRCGALLDVEPLGPDYVRAMCHDIEDPTFDATAVATNPRAQVRPIHRPPRVPADRNPHCAWTVIIDPAHTPVSPLPPYYAIEATRAATVELDPIVAGGEGADDYSGPLLSDLDFTRFSHSALVRIADEVCVQMHLLNLSYVLAVRKRARDAEQAEEICRKQLVGLAGIAARRIRDALALGADEAAAMRAIELHPLLNPVAYTGGVVDGTTLRVTPSDASADGAWIALCGPGDPVRAQALHAIVREIDPHFDVDIDGTDDDWTAHLARRAEPAAESSEVAVTAFSGGTTFEFEHRAPLPLFVV
ncbi:hypothetical protein [Nocardioides sp. R-C-SC26]|uniref:hypothetical protein n=1 Tax=Nocardioides sp. R-C-SC26 TaxID=2870414 RepID=UPI001E2AA70D|nr:hypothetical protein [Nocardioides sp. R-C-SC26]